MRRLNGHHPGGAGETGEAVAEIIEVGCGVIPVGSTISSGCTSKQRSPTSALSGKRGFGERDLAQIAEQNGQHAAAENSRRRCGRAAQ